MIEECLVLGQDIMHYRPQHAMVAFLALSLSVTVEVLGHTPRCSTCVSAGEVLVEILGNRTLPTSRLSLKVEQPGYIWF
jgi:hypothetical protein